MELDQVHIEMGSLSQTTDMDSFLREVNKLQENINAIELVINNVKLLQENILVNPNSDNSNTNYLFLNSFVFATLNAISN